MRTYTLAFSVVVHLLAIAAVLIAPVVATDVPPDPRRAFEFITVAPLPPSPPVPQRKIGRRNAGRTNPAAAPLDAPTTIAPERALEPFGAGDVGDERGIPGGLPGGTHGGVFIDNPPPPPPPPAPRAPTRIGGVIKEPQKIRHVAPAYPAVARSAGVQGIVILEAVIGVDGRVRNLRVLRSIPLLDPASLDAVRQWQFTPTLLNGEAVPVVMTVTVAFTLDGRR